jgi:hypothetical protein
MPSDIADMLESKEFAEMLANSDDQEDVIHC